MPGVMKALGLDRDKKKKPESATETVSRVAAQAPTGKLMPGRGQVEHLEQQIALMQSAVRKLGAAPHGLADDATMVAASRMVQAAEGLMGHMEGLVTAMPNARYVGNQKKLQHVVQDAQMILDERRVAKTKAQAGEIYMEAGRSAAKGSRPGPVRPQDTRNADLIPGDPAAARAQVAAAKPPPGVRGFEHLTGLSWAYAFGDLHDPLVQQKDAMGVAKPIREAGKALGLSEAELAAITTYTAQDYKYINPSTGRDEKWLAAAFPNKDEHAELKSEGTLHSGMAVQGLMKLPVLKPTKVWRGQGSIPDNVFKQKFVFDKMGSLSMSAPSASADLVPGAKYKYRNGTDKWLHITSYSKKEDVAVGFMTPGTDKRVLYEVDPLINGRDISTISANQHEDEVATLPGAEFQLKSAEVKSIPGKNAAAKPALYLHVKCKQRK